MSKYEKKEKKVARDAVGEEMYDDWFWLVIGAEGGKTPPHWDALTEAEKRAWKLLALKYLERE